MITKLRHKKCAQKSSNSKHILTRLVPRITTLILLVTTIGFFGFTFGCQENKSVDSKNKQTSPQMSQKENTPAKTVSTDQDNTPAVTENKPSNATPTTDEPPAVPDIDEAFIITPGKRMTTKRYFAVRDKLKQLGLAFHNFHDANHFFLPDPEKHPEYYDENGRLMLSWRVHMLPFLDQKELFQRFKLDEPWDSPTNAPLAKNMPGVFRSPDTLSDSNMTRFRMFEGEWITNSKGQKIPSSIFPTRMPTQVRNMSDGLSNTAMIIEAGSDQAIEWTKPGGLDMKSPIKSMGTTAEGIPAVMCDGRPVCIKKAVGDNVWKTLIQPADGSTINWDDIIIAHTMLTPKELNLQGKLSKISEGFFNYVKQNDYFLPPAKKHLINGKQMLSWRVHLLPYLGEEELYKQFNLKESWDSPHNKKLLDQMPDFYQFFNGSQPGYTTIMMFTGKGTSFPNGLGLSLDLIASKDGVSNTILCVIAAPDKAVPWTKPVDLPFNPVDPIKAMGKLSGKKFIAILMDGRIQTIPTNTSAKKLKDWIQYNNRPIPN